MYITDPKDDAGMLDNHLEHYSGERKRLEKSASQAHTLRLILGVLGLGSIAVGWWATGAISLLFALATHISYSRDLILAQAVESRYIAAAQIERKLIELKQMMLADSPK